MHYKEVARQITNRYAAMRVEVKTQAFVLRKNGSAYSYLSEFEPSQQQSPKRYLPSLRDCR